MGRISLPTGVLLVLGITLVILAGFDDGIPPSSELERYLPYFLLIGGTILIVVAIALMRKKVEPTGEHRKSMISCYIGLRFGAELDLVL